MIQHIQQKLFSLRDEKNAQFLAKLIPTLDSKTILGIKTPVLRKLAKSYSRELPSNIFLESLPHQYFDENLLHAFLIENMKDFSCVMRYTEAFLPYINNWAVCDSFSPKIFKNYPKEVLTSIKQWLESSHEYTVRYAIGLLLSNYLDEYFELEMLEWVAKLSREAYYVQMMQAWYFAEALVKQYDATIPFFESRQLPTFVHNKALQKARESRRISPEGKHYLQTLKI